MENEKSNRFTELFRRIEVTCKSRYNASARLQRQHTFSQWTIAFVSVALILVPLLRISEINLNYPLVYVDVMQIFFAVVVLVYSLLIGTENFSRRSEKLHRCGLELGRLAREVKPHKGVEDASLDEVYEKLASRYYDSLEKYENHTAVDFLYTKIDLASTYYPTRWKRYPAIMWASIRNVMVFMHHILIVLLIIVWIVLMVI